MKKNKKKSNIIFYILLTIMAAIDIIPFLWMVLCSFKTQKELFVFPPTILPKKWTFSNYTKAWHAGGLDFTLMFINTLKIVVPVTVFTVISSALAAYGFARIKFKGRDFIFGLFLSSMMVPYAVTLIPSFLIFKSLNWINSFKPLIIPSLFGSTFAIFLMRQFFMTIPMDLEEAATIDGCSRIGIWSKIFLPLCKPILATLVVFTFQGTYNDFMGPLIYLNSTKKFTVQLGLASFRGMYNTRYDLLMAASVFTLIPILIIYLAAQKYFVEGIVMTGLKG